jgi:hypothetical protein
VLAPLLCLALAACDHATPSNGSVNPSPPAASGDVVSAGGGSAGKGAHTMSGFETALAAWTSFASKELGVPADQLQAGPQAEVVKMEQTIGKAWAFTASVKTDASKTVRGWAMADGTVITTSQNYGALLEQAGLWSDAHSADMSRIPKSVAWSLGPGYSSYGDPDVDIKSDGSGTVGFVAEYRQAGPGGAGGGPSKYFNVIATVGKDHKASVKVSPK